jgi:hypothetical protein
VKRKYCLIANVILLAWFFLDMVGVYFKNNHLVTRSWRDDGIFFIIFLGALILFLLKENVGKYILIIWQSLWLLTQFISHEWYTIVGGGEEKIRFFEGSIKFIKSDLRYIPDVYHIVLHILILVALISTIIYSMKSKRYS